MNHATGEKKAKQGVRRISRWKKILLWACSVILVAGISVGAYMFAALRAYKNFDDLCWRRHQSQKVSQAELREAAHQALRFPLPYYGHDAFITLSEIGDISSVPYLFRGLRWQEHTGPDGVMGCTKAHCLDALRRITGHNAGENYEDWKAWWVKIGSKRPRKSFPTAAERLVFHDFEDGRPWELVDEDLQKLGAEANSALLRGLKDKSRAIRNGCIMELFERPSIAAQALSDLMQTFNDTNTYNRMLGAWAVGGLTTNRADAIRVLEKETANPDARYSAFAGIALAGVVPERSGSGLLFLQSIRKGGKKGEYRNRNWWMRRRIVEVMGKVLFITEEERKMLAEVAADEFEEKPVREVAKAALSKIDTGGKN